MIYGKDIIPELLSLRSANNVEIITEDVIERAHREVIPKPKDSVRSRDVIVALCKERLTDQLLKELRKKGPLNYKGATIRFFPDLSLEASKRRQERELTVANCRFSWIYPTTILVIKNNKKFKAKNSREAELMLQSMGISSPERIQEQEQEPEGE
ncbi:hypothetical protein JRQ81_012231 [Phrynocephalus forsythii]|uniref:Uncharacterized protein n=1 Tax=Phrynocephalus forsythii TaxID=171643 RepID=A0A9Q0X5H1_9SAUR|nr:hypothetical protein JRQ81_012231 [Phrynocephalus forsythii]